MNFTSFIPPLAALLLAPLLPGVIQRVKALFAGRQGPPLLQLYFDLFKLLRRGATYSQTTTWIFRAAPIVGLAALLVTLLLLPFAGLAGPLAFAGDLLLLAYLLSMTRFFTVLGALDTGSAFTGMGASREVFFSALAEPALFLCLVVLVQLSGSLSLSPMLQLISADSWLMHGPALLLVVAALFIVALAENARIPVDDPATHLELTMIHEVMILDHGGPDLAFILYATALKLWVFCSLLASLILPLRWGPMWLNAVVGLVSVLAVAVAIGLIESTLARLKLLRVPKLLVGASAIAALALVMVAR